MNESARPVSLHLLRHADAGDPEAWRGDDDLRPLSKKGIRQAERLGRHLAAAGFSTDALLTSPKARARETAEIVGAALGVQVRLDERLGGQVGLPTVEAILRDLESPERPVLVGHDPDFSDLLMTLVDGRNVPMKKGAIARIDLAGGLEPGGGTLRWLLSPDVLPRER